MPSAARWSQDRRSSPETDTGRMAILRTDISSALDDLINDEADTSFQATGNVQAGFGLAVVLAKQKWPDLIAS